MTHARAQLPAAPSRPQSAPTNQPHPDAAAGSGSTWSTLVCEARLELAALHAELEELHAKIRPAAERLAELEREDNLEMIGHHASADIFADPDLLSEFSQRAWNSGRGSGEVSGFLRSAFADLAPGIIGFEHEVAEDYITVVRILPKLYLSRNQDISPVADALERIFEAIAVDGLARVDILDHECDVNDSWTLEMRSPTTAALIRGRSADRSGGLRDLRDVLTYVARHHWGTLTPHD